MQMLRSLMLILAAAIGPLAHGQTYPAKTVTLLVAYPPGGPADAVARAIAPTLQTELGQAVIVDNIAGVGGALGAQRVLSAAPDGHTIMFATPIELVQTPMAVAGAKYRPEDFRMIGPVASTHLAMIVRPDLPVASVGEFIALAKKPGAKELTYGSVGRGSAYHLVAERFAQDTGIKMLHVPYKGAQQLVTDLAGGQIDMAFLALGGPVPGLLQQGRFKTIGYTGRSRHPTFPQTPTMDESKVVKDFVFDLWGALVVSKNVPDPVVAKLSTALKQALKQPQLRKTLEATGVLPADPAALDQVADFYASEITRYQSIGRSINLQPE